jgi:hypothetical protein
MGWSRWIELIGVAAATARKASFKRLAGAHYCMSVSELEADLSEDEHAGLELIRETGGIHQSDFWKELDVSSRKGSRIAEALEDSGLIQRSDTVYDGHNTYYLEPAPRDLNFSLLMAGDMLSPFIGEEEVDAQADAFSQWMMNLAYEEY